MPLSDREEQLLKELEGTLQPARTRSRYQGAAGIGLLVLGLVLLLAGAVVPSVALGVLGYLVMLGGALAAQSSTLGDAARGRITNRVKRAADERREQRNRHTR